MRKVNLLFTGGFDSTFRLCQLSRMDVEVQPVYFSFDDIHSRRNQLKEIEAQGRVISWLKARKETTARILPPAYVFPKDLPSDPAYDRAFQKWKFNYFIPAQLRTLGKVPLLYPDLEIGREGPTLKNRKLGNKYGKTRLALMARGMRFTDRPDGSVLVDGSQAEEGLALLFCRFKYPILGIPETGMVPFIHEWGYEDVFKLTWTCDNGNEEQCGVCHNCETKWASGLENFFGETGQRNHDIKLFLEKHNDELVQKYFPNCLYNLSEMFTKYVAQNYFYTLNFNPNPALPLPVRQKLSAIFQQKSLDIMSFFKMLMNHWVKGKGVILDASKD